MWCKAADSCSGGDVIYICIWGHWQACLYLCIIFMGSAIGSWPRTKHSSINVWVKCSEMTTLCVSWKLSRENERSIRAHPVTDPILVCFGLCMQQILSYTNVGRNSLAKAAWEKNVSWKIIINQLSLDKAMWNLILYVCCLLTEKGLRMCWVLKKGQKRPLTWEELYNVEQCCF